MTFRSLCENIGAIVICVTIFGAVMIPVLKIGDFVFGTPMREGLITKFRNWIFIKYDI
jgi:hypothetical protein